MVPKLRFKIFNVFRLLSKATFDLRICETLVFQLLNQLSGLPGLLVSFSLEVSLLLASLFE